MSFEIRYVKRVEMVLDLATYEACEPTLPDGFFWTPWNSLFVSAHALILHNAFRDDLDGCIFPTYRQYEACEHLIRATSSVRSFAPEGTWLIGRQSLSSNHGGISVGRPIEYCAAIQCVCQTRRVGEIQNVSTLPQFRRLGLGRALVAKALFGFIKKGRSQARLEVTAENVAALRLYASLGFCSKKILYSESFIETGCL